MRYLLDGYETNRLKFRLLEENDFDKWIELFKVPEAKFLGLGHENNPEKQCKIWFEKTFSRYENDRGGMNVLVDKKTNQLIGQSGLLIQDIDDQEELEIAYSILPEFWKMGYASEASQKCKEAAFTNDYSNSLISIIHVDNLISKKVAIKNGLKKEKTTTFLGMQVEVFRINKNNFEKKV